MEIMRRFIEKGVTLGILRLLTPVLAMALAVGTLSHATAQSALDLTVRGPAADTLTPALNAASVLRAAQA